MNINKIKILAQYFTPKLLLTRLVGCFASAKLGRLTSFAIRRYINLFNINTAEMKGKIEDYKTFNDFFARELKENARPIAKEDDALISPVDGHISQFGHLRDDLLLQAKNHYFTLDALCAGDADAAAFINGDFITIYLSPQDYHRVHMPIDGKLLKMIYVPGELFSVNPLYVQNIPELFSRNERVICIFDTPIGKMALIFVGAEIVRSIITEWAGVVAPHKKREISTFSYAEADLPYKKGAQIGRFAMGSTVICLFAKDKIEFAADLKNEAAIKMGHKIATLK